MNIIDIINKKRNSQILTSEEIQFVIDSYLNNSIKDYQMSSLLMAICINGMTEEETINLTTSMLNSGKIIDLREIEGIKVDKHSTGGVGDKTTLIVIPLVASCGVKVVKMSGRGLGFTGGTIDKLEAIPGFKTKLSIREIIDQVNEIGICNAYGNNNLVPADKKIYALRDTTGTVDSIPLIASSIMSKKLASGVDKIVIDLKVGNGAFMKNLEDAKKLARLMIKIGKNHNKEVVCILSNMNQPLGNMIGNSLEVLEAMETLEGKGPTDITNLSLIIAAYMVSLGLNISVNDALEMVKQKLIDKSAYNKFLEFVNYQNGNINKLIVKSKKLEIKSTKSGFISKIDTEKLGYVVMELGAGRSNIYDDIDYSVGIKLHKKIGDTVNVQEKLITVYYNKEVENIHERIMNCFKIVDDVVEIPNLIYGVIE